VDIVIGDRVFEIEHSRGVALEERLPLPRALRYAKLSSGRVKLYRAPGGLAESFARLFSKRSRFRGFVSQLIADMREEALEEISKHRFLRARFIVLRGYGSLLFTLLAYIGSATVKRLLEIWKLV
jgi:hypothetical protein